MKKIISVITAAVAVFCSCAVKSDVSGIEITAKSTVYEVTNTEPYTTEDMVVLQDFILGKRTDSNGKNFDLNNDNRWDVFDMCLMRSKVTENQENTGDNDILVTYFSCTNNTESIAKYAIDYLNADSYEIIPEIPYTEEDLKYYTDCRADKEQADPTARPEIAGTVENMEDYEIVFVGYPVWHGQAPKIIYTFLESYDFSDKIIVPFCTSASSGIGTSAENLHVLTSKSTTWFDGKRFSGSASKSEVTEWIDSMNLNSSQKEQNTMYITIGDTKLSAEFADNSSAEALKNLLKDAPLTINMSDYGNFEKVGSIGTSLPQNDGQITTEAGDIILYQGDKITIYYDKNSWNFTRLGKIKNITQAELKEILGSGNVTVTFSVD